MLSPDLDMARRHIELLTGSSDTNCCFRLLRGTGAGWNLSGPIANLWPRIETMQREGWQAFVIVNQGGHLSREIHCVRAFFVDADGLPLPAEWHAKPSFIVQRDSTHWHAYWTTDIPDAGTPRYEFRENFKAAQKGLAAHYGTDPKVCDLPRIMRLAGTLHLKDPAHPILITIIDDSGPRQPRPATALFAGLPELCGAVVKPARSRLASGDPVSLDIVRDMLSYLDAGCGRDEWLTIIAAIHAAPVPDDEDESGRRVLAHEWSETGANYSGREDVDRVFDDMQTPGPDDDHHVHFGTLVTKARAAGYTGPIRIEPSPEERWGPVVTYMPAERIAELDRRTAEYNRCTAEGKALAARLAQQRGWI